MTWGDVFTVQPFGNIMQVITLAGAQIKAVPEQQFGDPVAGQNRILQVGRGFTYTRENAAKGSKVSNVQFGGAAIDPAASYRVTLNDFLTDGGDSFTVFSQGTDRTGGDVDLAAFRNCP
ncbi:5'-nucleotidase C-terminal domain-containing protein [Deinococcus petrolearius]|uniref:5'-nucleotidase C-terminal domain-containing protein n=1 Tax=Deinococcus petrolearius TaxID=1751295 RepID=A0ABW1DG88_9DEIO